MAFTFYETVYLDKNWLIGNTSITEIIDLSDDVIDSLIIKAQLIIDWYIWEIEKANEDQNFKFPSIDSNPDIPINITMATLYIVENLFIQYKKEQWKEYSQESWDWYSKTYKDWNELLSIEIIDGNIKNLLLEYWVNPENQNKKSFKINF